MDPPLPDEDRGEEAHPTGDLSEVLQDAGEQAEDRAEEECPPGTSPPQGPPKVLTQLSVGDGERERGCVRTPMPVMGPGFSSKQTPKVHTNQELTDLGGGEQQHLKIILGN